MRFNKYLQKHGVCFPLVFLLLNFSVNLENSALTETYWKTLTHLCLIWKLGIIMFCGCHFSLFSNNVNTHIRVKYFVTILVYTYTYMVYCLYIQVSPYLNFRKRKNFETFRENLFRVLVFTLCHTHPSPPPNQQIQRGRATLNSLNTDPLCGTSKERGFFN